MIRKYPYLWGGLILALLALNLWRYLPAWGGKAKGPGASAAGLALEFPQGPEGEAPLRRNLFDFGAAPSHVSRPRKAAPVAALPTPLVTPTPSAPDGSVAEAAGGYRLLGVISRDGRSQALVGKGDQLFQVGRGDDIEGRYHVVSIDENEVYLTEKQTGNNLKLRIWDSQGATP